MSSGKIQTMREIDIPANRLITTLLDLDEDRSLCLLDSCGVGHLGSHLLVAGIDPVDRVELRGLSPDETLSQFNELINDDLVAIFTISYDFGARMHGIETMPRSDIEPDIFIARFDRVIVHDYLSGKTFAAGGDPPSGLIDGVKRAPKRRSKMRPDSSRILSNYSRDDYIAAVDDIKELIRSGETYQTNLTQRITVPTGLTPAEVFLDLRRDHPAPFAAFLRRPSSTVVSASPERFFKIENGSISASPIKGTRPRGATLEEDDALRAELLASEKDRAENTMIVDLLRNDLGRVCEFGSVEVEKLCDLEEHPTLFHLVSTIRGRLRPDAAFPDILKATFPCGSITGAPKLRTMKIINDLEPNSRGLSMGAIGICTPARFGISRTLLDLNVAIRTMTLRQGEAVFNVGGGITIDSDPESEYAESILKAKALLTALGYRETPFLV